MLQRELYPELARALRARAVLEMRRPGRRIAPNAESLDLHEQSSCSSAAENARIQQRKALCSCSSSMELNGGQYPTDSTGIRTDP